MPYMNSKMIVSNYDGHIETEGTTGTSTVFSESQMFPALDGTWLMVDWFTYEDGQFSWYVTTQ